MTPEDLTPADREIAQLALVRIWLGRKRRAEFAAVRLAPARRVTTAQPVVPMTNGATGHTDHARRLAAARRRS